MWRVLRLASKSRLTLFDKLENDVQDLQPLYRPDLLGSNLGDEGSEKMATSDVNATVIGDRDEPGLPPASSSPALQDTAVR